VPLKVYDQTLGVLKSAVSSARLGLEEELGALRRLDEQARLLERHTRGPTLEEHLAAERAASHANGGRSIFGWEGDPIRTAAAAGKSVRPPLDPGE
jgi:hypothetical protein